MKAEFLSPQVFVRSIVAILVFAPCFSLAQTQTVQSKKPASATTTVRQVFNDRGRVVAETADTDLKVGDEMVITLENGKQCALPILEVRGSYLTLVSENCRYGFDIKPGHSLEKSLLSPVAAVPAAAPPQALQQAAPQPQQASHEPQPAPLEKSLEPESTPKRRPKFALGLAFSGRTASSGTGGTATGYAGTFTTEFEYKEGLSVSLEIRDTPLNSWGYGIGLTYDSTREFDSGSISSGGTTISLTGTGGASQISSNSIEMNAIYRWTAFYIPLGLNYTAMRFTPAPGYTGGFNIYGGLGAQLGLGVHITDAVSIEMISRASGYSLKLTQGGNTTNFGEMIYSIVTFGVKGHF